MGAYAQISTDPAVPTVNNPVTVQFDASGTPLAESTGFDGDIYAHTGVYTNQSPPEDEVWTCVKTEWPGNRDDMRLDPVGDDQYELDIEDTRAYYNDNETGCTLGEDEVIQTMNFVFRDANGETQTDDLFVELGDPDATLSLAITNPQVPDLNPLIVDNGETVTIEAEAVESSEELEEMTLTLDGEVQTTTTETTLSYPLTFNNSGTRTLEVSARGVSGTEVTEVFDVVVAPPIEDEARPAGIEDGITYNSGTSVTLSIYGPGKEHVYVIGDFNDWTVSNDYALIRDPGGEESNNQEHWWITVDGLDPNTEYGYQYLVDGDLRIPDPYSEKVLTQNDQFISEETYPNLKPYPGDETAFPVTTFTTTPPEFDFSAFDRPDQDELVIYELLVRDFIASHDFSTLTDTLDYIDRLGVNAIELMPVNEFDGNLSWGYNPSLHYAVDKYYGPPETLKQFIEEAHQRGIAVILDVVYNHATGQSPLVRLFNEATFGPPTSENPWYNPEARHPFNVFNDMNHDSALTKTWLDRVNRFWLEKYNVDGFRFDLSKGFAQGPDPGGWTDVGAWSAFNQERIDNLTRMADELWSVDDRAYIILEHLGALSEEQILTEHGTDDANTDGTPGMMVWNKMSEQYSQSAMGYEENSDFSGTYYQFAGYNVPNTVAYMESHDEQWMMYKNIAFGNSSGDYDVTERSTALERQKLAGTFFFTIPGSRMMWQFGELGYGYGDSGEQCLRQNDCPPEAPGRTQEKPIRWDYRDPNQSPDRVRLYKTWSALINLRMENPVFHDVEQTQIVDPLLSTNTLSNRRIILEHPSDMSAVIVGNFGAESSEVTPNFPNDTDGDGVWYDFFTGRQFEVDADNRDASVTFEPGEYHIFTSEVPEGGFPEPDITNFDFPGAPLPMELATFNATRQGEDATVLTWSTAPETNNAGFQIQRNVTTSDGAAGSFERIGFVDGEGTTTQPQSYRFTDDDLPFEATSVTYRLRQVDMDGTESLSQEIRVDLPPQKLALHDVFPNPVRQSATLRYALPESGTVRISVYNLLGQRVTQLVNGEKPAGRKTLTLNTGTLASGTYFVQMEAPSGVRTTRFTVVR